MNILLRPKANVGPPSENRTHVADVRPVAGVRSEHAVQEIVVRPSLAKREEGSKSKSSRLHRGPESKLGSSVSVNQTHLLEDEERGEGARDVELDQVKAGFPIRQ